MDPQLTPEKMREQGKRMIAVGNQLLAAADAADEAINAANKIFINGSEPAATRIRTRMLSPAFSKVVQAVNDMRTVVEIAAEILSEHGGVLHKDVLFKKVQAAGGKVKTAESLISLLGQDRKERFASKGQGIWGFRQQDLPMKTG